MLIFLAELFHNILNWPISRLKTCFISAWKIQDFGKWHVSAKDACKSFSLWLGINLPEIINNYWKNHNGIIQFYSGRQNNSIFKALYFVTPVLHSKGSMFFLHPSIKASKCKSITTHWLWLLSCSELTSSLKSGFSSFPNWDLQSNILNFLQRTNFSCTTAMYNALGSL